MIDLRSDTVTRPTAGMREAIAAAPVGDDVYAEDPTVADLERRTAEVLGHEAGLYCATGSLSNLLGVRLVVPPGSELLCDVRAHVVRAELGAHAAVHGITTRTWTSPHGISTAAEIADLIEPSSNPYLVTTAAVALENTHNFGGGTVQPIAHLREVHELCRAAGVGLHLDGARLWNAHVATGVPLAEYGRLFDTVSVCYSKGMGAPMGSVLVSSAENIARARVWRKRLGGGWRQAGMMAAGCAYALEHHLERLADDHQAARAFADEVAERAPQAVDAPAVETNIVVVDTGARRSVEVAAAALEAGVLLSAVGPHSVRAVTHLDVTTTECREAGRTLGELLAG